MRKAKTKMLEKKPLKKKSGCRNPAAAADISENGIVVLRVYFIIIIYILLGEVVVTLGEPG